MKSVLLIEDEKDIQRIWKGQFDRLLKTRNEKICLLFATSIDEAAKQFNLHQNEIIAIVFDGCIEGPGKEPNTEILVKAFGTVFKGPMVATSGQPAFRKILLEAGCTHECYKEDAPKKVVELLGLV